MRRLTTVFGFAFFASTFCMELGAQQYAEQPGYSSSALPAQPLPPPATADQHFAQPQSTAHPQYGAQPHYYAQHHAATGQCGCAACTQQPSECWTIFYRNTRWPSPFKLQDIDSVTSYFAVQRENGWKMHNTVGHVLFDPKSDCLTEAGKNHIRSILTDNPADRRVVFVLQGQSPQQTSQRIESVQLAISELVPTGDLPPIYVTDRDAPGSSGAYQTAVTRAMMTSLPAPRLPSFNAAQGNP